MRYTILVFIILLLVGIIGTQTAQAADKYPTQMIVPTEHPDQSDRATWSVREDDPDPTLTPTYIWRSPTPTLVPSVAPSSYAWR